MGSRKAVPKARKSPRQQLEDYQRIQRSQEKALHAIWLEATRPRRKQEKTLLERQEQERDRAARRLASPTAELTKHHDQLAELAKFRKYKEAYNKNLIQEGFEIRGENWERLFVAEDETTQSVRFQRLHFDVGRVHDIPSNYEYVTWEHIKHEHMWYVKRNANYSRCGFVIDRSRSWAQFDTDGIFAFHVDRPICEFWTWPGAVAGCEHLPQNVFPQDQPKSVYQDKDITQINDSLFRQCCGLKYENRAKAPINPHTCVFSWLGLFSWVLLEEKQQRCYYRNFWRQLLDIVNWLSYIAGRRGEWLLLFQKCSFWSKLTLPNEQKCAKEFITYEVPGTLNGREIAAFPDSGSGYNLLSYSYTIQNGITFQDQEITITLPNGTRGHAMGVVRLDWEFGDGPGETHRLLFYVLKNCVHDVLFGKSFVDLTKLHTDNEFRIKQRTVLSLTSSLRSSGGAFYDCHLTGNILNRMSGDLNGQQSYVIPDSGCQVNAMSLAQALALGWDSKYRGERGTFRFIDGSTAPSLGAMRIMWSPTGSEKKYELEFEIMENCKGIIIGQKFLYGNRAFVKHAASMINVNAVNTTKTDEIANEESEKRISTTNNLGGPTPPPPKTTIQSTPMPVPAHEIITTDDKIYGVTYNASPLARIRRRLRGSGSRDSGARSQTSSVAQEEMERRAVIENPIASMGTWESRILAVEAEVNRRRLARADGGANVTLLGLLPGWCTGVARGEAETGHGSGDGDGSRSGNSNDDGTSRSS